MYYFVILAHAYIERGFWIQKLNTAPAIRICSDLNNSPRNYPCNERLFSVFYSSLHLFGSSWEKPMRKRCDMKSSWLPNFINVSILTCSFWFPFCEQLVLCIRVCYIGFKKTKKHEFLVAVPVLQKRKEPHISLVVCRFRARCRTNAPLTFSAVPFIRTAFFLHGCGIKGPYSIILPESGMMTEDLFSVKLTPW